MSDYNIWQIDAERERSVRHGGGTISPNQARERLKSRGVPPLPAFMDPASPEGLALLGQQPAQAATAATPPAVQAAEATAAQWTPTLTRVDTIGCPPPRPVESRPEGEVDTWTGTSRMEPKVQGGEVKEGAPLLQGEGEAEAANPAQRGQVCDPVSPDSVTPAPSSPGPIGPDGQNRPNTEKDDHGDGDPSAPEPTSALPAPAPAAGPIGPVEKTKRMRLALHAAAARTLDGLKADEQKAIVAVAVQALLRGFDPSQLLAAASDLRAAVVSLNLAGGALVFAAKNDQGSYELQRQSKLVRDEIRRTQSLVHRVIGGLK